MRHETERCWRPNRLLEAAKDDLHRRCHGDHLRVEVAPIELHRRDPAIGLRHEVDDLLVLLSLRAAKLPVLASAARPATRYHIVDLTGRMHNFIFLIMTLRVWVELATAGSGWIPRKRVLLD